MTLVVQIAISPATARQQSSREFASADPTPGEKARAVHITRFSAQSFLAAYAAVYNTFNVHPPLHSRPSQNRGHGDVEHGDTVGMMFDIRTTIFAADQR